MYFEEELLRFYFEEIQAEFKPLFVNFVVQGMESVKQNVLAHIIILTFQEHYTNKRNSQL